MQIVAIAAGSLVVKDPALQFILLQLIALGIGFAAGRARLEYVRGRAYDRGYRDARSIHARTLELLMEREQFEAANTYLAARSQALEEHERRLLQAIGDAPPPENGPAPQD